MSRALITEVDDSNQGPELHDGSPVWTGPGKLCPWLSSEFPDPEVTLEKVFKYENVGTGFGDSPTAVT